MDTCPRNTATAGKLVIAMTDEQTRRAHYVTDEATAAGRAGDGRYAALCGAVVIPGSLATPDGIACSRCASWAQEKKQHDAQNDSSLNKQGLLRALRRAREILERL